ncbi:MAG: DUF3891 family protein [Chitinophagaceae bacterium]|nr:DUF3891 family protein [Chitinophagaceae bacterium]
MIVNYTESGWQIITQRSHGLLAAQICAQWAKNKQPARWIETLIATADHDEVYNEWENEDLLNETGGPKNFKATFFHKDDGDHLIRMAETKSAYTALLISHHIRFVHGKDPNAQEFCKMLQRQEKKWLAVSGADVEQVNRSYELLEFCDAFSLLICQGLIQPEHRKIEISSGPDGEPYAMYSTKEEAITVVPWPFEVPSFEVIYETRTLSQLAFKNVKEFRKALEKTEVVTQKLLLHRTP